ncbi:MAG: S-methyl-5-thioribose-1-phosphate isomerase [Elusimicrobia bacterium]|nr:S-methyl-5-thioribose-1-phosphate isomerase [Elusimicrobiota bacterium]MDE2313597.1 S-methyl-5-thioribose-1-phosphate isomerase [Elusimicrobiota bacterium]
MAKSFPLKDPVAPVRWTGSLLKVLDQRLLPHKVVYLNCSTPEDVARATKSMALRGAPLIGCAAAYAMALAARRGGFRGMEAAAPKLLRARPTAVNLAHAVSHMLAKGRQAVGIRNFADMMSQAAGRYYALDLQANRDMAVLGASLLKKRNCRVMTYCNAGALATSGLGTAVGVIRYAHHLGKVERVYCCETRPYLQGSRLTLWEFMKAGVPATLITDNAAAHLIKSGAVDAVFVGSDRIAANGDVCNKIGTYGVALAAKRDRVPFYAVAPISTIDPRCPSGSRIPIEERSSAEVLKVGSCRIAPRGARAAHFAFDVTPRDLVGAIVTERGIIKPVNRRSIKRILHAI